jgi:hypothetical protein
VYVAHSESRHEIVVRDQLHAAAALPRKRTQVRIDRSLGGPQGRSGRSGEEKKSLTPAGIRTQDNRNTLDPGKSPVCVCRCQ